MLLCATIALSFALASGVAVAQEPPAAPVPKLPAMPSLEQKGSDDMTKPAGASAGKAAKPAPEPKHAGKDAKKREPEPPAATPKALASQPNGQITKSKPSAAKSKASGSKASGSKASGSERKPTAKAASPAKYAAKASKTRKPAPAKKSRRSK